MSEDPQSLDSLGGANRVAEIVDEAFERVFADDELRAIFEPADKQLVSSIKAHLVTVITDGPVQHSDAELTELYHGLGIQEKHYSVLVRHLVDVLEHNGVSQELVNEILGRLAVYSNRITGTPNVDG